MRSRKIKHKIAIAILELFLYSNPIIHLKLEATIKLNSKAIKGVQFGDRFLVQLLLNVCILPVDFYKLLPNSF